MRSFSHTKAAHLTPSETRVFPYLKQDKSYKEIAQTLGMSLANVHTTVAHIRKKLGVKAGRSFFFVKYREDDGKNTPTPIQRSYMESLAAGQPYRDIAKAHGVTSQNVQNVIATGCKRAGIRGHGHQRTEAIRAYIHQGKANVTMDDPAFN